MKAGLIVLSILMMAFAAMAGKSCFPPRELIELRMANVLDAAHAKIKEAEVFAIKYKDAKREELTFDTAVFRKLILELENIGVNVEQSNFNRSEAFRISAALYGLISFKISSAESADCGNNAIRQLKKSIELIPNNEPAIVGLASTISGIAHSSFPRIAAHYTGIRDLKAEVRNTLQLMRRLTTPKYQRPELEAKLIEYLN